MLGIFKRKSKRTQTTKQQDESAFLFSVGVRTESDREYRHERISNLLNITGDNDREGMKKLLDSWTIDTLEHSMSEDPRPKTVYLPRPLWDDEAILARDTFDTKEAAIKYVRDQGGAFASEVASKPSDRPDG